MQVLGRATGPELGQQVHAACAGPVLIPIACAQPYLGRPVPGEDEDRHRRSSFNRRGGGIQAMDFRLDSRVVGLRASPPISAPLPPSRAVLAPANHVVWGTQSGHDV